MNRSLKIVILFLVSLLAVAFCPRPVQATNNAIISAPYVVDTQLGPGSVVTFSINVSNVGPSPETLHAWQLFFHLNATLLKITQVIEGPALSDIANALGGNTLFTGKFNATSGLVQASDLIVVTNYPDAGFMGNGTLLYVKVQVLTSGTTSLNVDHDALISVFNNQASSIGHTVVNGLFSNVPFNIPPTASFTVSPNPTVGIPVHLDASASHDPDGSIVTYSWNFGDGNHTSVSGPMIDHVYQRVGGPLTVALTVTDNGGANASTHQNIFIAAVNTPPIAVFTFSPSNPMPHQTVTFNATGSYDPDGDSIFAYYWNFGDGFLGVNGVPTIQHTFNSVGVFNVTLTVDDSFQLRTSISKFIFVSAQPVHDVGISSIQAFPATVISGGTVNVNVGLVNQGTSDEVVDLTVYFDTHIINTLKGIPISANPIGENFVFVNVPWDTTGVPTGNYTVSATVFLATDQSPNDNSLTDGQVQILPPPTISLTPSTGVVGTKVFTQVSGLPGPTYPYQTSAPVLLSFDDNFIGEVIRTSGSFSFTFNVPLAQPGAPHVVKILDLFSGAKASASFQVLPSQNMNLAITVQVASLYFPGDTANIFTLTTLNGSPVAQGTYQPTLTLIIPNGTSIVLTGKFLPDGLYESTYSIPTKGLGTYAVLATVKVNGINATTIAIFEAKPSWLQSHGSQAATGLASAAVAGVALVAWRKGFLRKKTGSETSFDV